MSLTCAPPPPCIPAVLFCSSSLLTTICLCCSFDLYPQSIQLQDNLRQAVKKLTAGEVVDDKAINGAIGVLSQRWREGYNKVNPVDNVPTKDQDVIMGDEMGGSVDQYKNRPKEPASHKGENKTEENLLKKVWTS